VTTRSAELLMVVHAHPGITRAAAARLLGIGTGAAAELVSRLCQADLLAETPAAPSGSRGRPTTALGPHPAGPLILAAAITHESWRLDAVELGGATRATARGVTSAAATPGSAFSASSRESTSTTPGRESASAAAGRESVIAAITGAVRALCSEFPGRVRGLGIAAPGTVSRDLRLDASGLDWHDLDLTRIWPDAEVLVAGNDATLAATAESARGAALGANTALHLRIEAGLGGALVDNGRVLVGALGAAGEFGHMPFGDPAITCPCGACGCWGTAVDGSTLARLLGQPPPADPVSYARRIIRSPQPADRRATRIVATALGRGIAGLVNGLDPDLVTLGGLGVDLLAVAHTDLDAAYRSGLMTFRRADPPPVIAAALGDEGPLLGAAEEAWTALLTRLA
jgi:predicted NBD/HSP70 family sugar kinase